ncbi:MAG: cold-shock protein [Candidatus Omnitrophica bacterium]|nr:cold-shock protein [Candidatus Omnitrophota bacterium]MCB9719968.1 cold-shock protein [Candidatus Omnitrophota bacterium]
MEIGKVTEFYPAAGFGYLRNGKKREYCFYSADIQDEKHALCVGDEVEFNLYVGHGVRAVNVRKREAEGKTNTSQ